MVKIHGDWCGPNWTQGRNVPANTPGIDFKAPCQDKLDCGCRTHDQDCAKPGGCSKAGDRKLVAIALKEALNPINILLRPKYADKAAFVAAGIQVQIPFRKR
jgi:hypothetical protein